MKRPRGYTIVELIIAVGGVLMFCLMGFAAYAAIHFILKYW